MLLFVLSSRRDCLRQMVIHLCERRELKTLISLPYKDSPLPLDQELVAILTYRARVFDPRYHNFYDLIYAFHMEHDNYRRGKLLFSQICHYFVSERFEPFLYKGFIYANVYISARRILNLGR